MSDCEAETSSWLCLCCMSLSVESAVAARAALDGMEWCGAASVKMRVLFVEHAKMDQSVFFSDAQHALQLPNAWPLEKISPMSVCSVEELPTVVSNGQLEKGVVSGLLLVNDFVSEAEEKALLEYLEARPWNEVKRRHVQHYGFEFNYRVNDIDRQAPLTVESSDGQRIPAIFQPLMERLRVLGALDKQAAQQEEEDNATPTPLFPSASAPAPPRKVREYIPDQLTVNKYRPGHGIPPHVDTHSAFTDIIISISLGSNIVMELLPTPSCQFLLNLPNEPVNVVLPPRSMLCLSGISRYGYTHAIIPRQTDRINNVLTKRQTRVSLTFRQLRQMSTSTRKPKCKCPFTSDCDTKALTQANSNATIAAVGPSSAAAPTRNISTSSSSSSAAAASSASRSSSPSPSSSRRISAGMSTAPAGPPADVDAFLASLPPAPISLSPEIEACHRAACAEGKDTYIDPATGYMVFTALGLLRQRAGVCCGNACRHCPFSHVNVKPSRKKPNFATSATASSTSSTECTL